MGKGLSTTFNGRFFFLRAHLSGSDFLCLCVDLQTLLKGAVYHNLDMIKITTTTVLIF